MPAGAAAPASKSARVTTAASPSADPGSSTAAGTEPWIVSDTVWEAVAPLLPARERRHRHPGRRPLEDRLVLQGVLYVLSNGIGWEQLPQSLGFGSGMTCWRRFQSWQHDGTWERIAHLVGDGRADLPSRR